ncbi:DUF4091 domain-containing protein [Lederbergia citrea]|uniref:DUF4091 domain-containing protein n=1 Tax=Lederbergia citrea TaxID=2833581 RepID=A0A942Z4D5_9BACI|nr:DUF4091 domain-containing protein [Lederbergia citrea]MBS4179363.1 DUF4091 domain-containing protein [Lederbergia citrea]MBS4206033.1 DUF4091 domain-containing protein [Lederbergia citrea]MBS4224518.1 DUF4091 domain-containing protein [Lederbergia citrea]
MANFEFLLTDSLEKVFPEAPPTSFSSKSISVFQNEQFSFQLAYHCYDRNSKINIHVEADDSIHTSVSVVKKVPSNLPAYPDSHDENYLYTTPGLFPDLLEPVSDGNIELETDGWNSIWFDVNPQSGTVGETTIKLHITDETNTSIYEQSINFRVIPHSLPEQTLIHTQWFHADSLANYYQVEAFSDEHWRVIENFIKTAKENGINMLLTPIFTPPLDTKVGGERTTVQLVQISFIESEYSFDFSLLKKWLEICKRNGIKYIEIAHLFTQWGAQFTPKIMVMENGDLVRKFGWDVAADSMEYRSFLDSFLPALTEFLKANWEAEKVYFHISDEPNESNIATYSKAKAIAEPHLKDFKIIDALSDYSFFQKGIVTKPVIASDHIQPFIDNNLSNLWVYYCCAQNKNVSNRFMAMPSARNRIIATQLFKYNIEGFLHWGYNFYNSQYSIEPIDPYVITDANKAFPSGDSFLVYPGKNGEAIPSIRSRVFYHALQDLRAFQLLEQLKGKAFVLNIIEKNQTITFTDYPVEKDYIFQIREEINREIEQAL